MKLLLISTDRGLLNPQSLVSARMRSYGELFETLDVIVFARGNHASVALTPNVHVYSTCSRTRFGYFFDAVRIASKLTFDVVSGQDSFETGLVARRLARIHGAALHLQVHTDVFAPAFAGHSPLNRVRVLIARWLLPQARGIRVVSERIAASIRTQLPGRTVDPVVLPIMVHAAEVTAQTFPYAQTILMVSRLESEKRVERGIDAFARIAHTHPDVGLVIAGDGRLRSALEARRAQLGLTTRVQFLGAINNVQALYAAADVFLQLSAYEGYGMTIVEAALAGVPILTTDVGVVGELLVDGGSCLVTDGTVADIALKLERLLDEEPLRQVLGARAQEGARTHVQTPEAYAAAYKAAFTVSVS